MKQIKVLVFLVFGVVEFLAVTEARFIFDLPYGDPALERTEVENERPAMPKFPDAFASNDDERGKCLCWKDSCICIVKVDDQPHGLNGTFSLILTTDRDGYLYLILVFNGKLVLGSFVTTDVLDQFESASCTAVQNEYVCFEIAGNSSRVDKEISGCANIWYSDRPTMDADFGCFSLDFNSASSDEMKNASPPDATWFPELFATEQERLRLVKERILTKNNFPRMDNEIL